MITVNLKGGLGNQMFQYACARALAKRNNDELSIYTTGLERANAVGDIYREFSLQHFNITAKITNERRSLNSRLIGKVFRILGSLLGLDMWQVGFDSRILNKKGIVWLDGYFQSEKYFANYSDVIRAEFVLKEPLQGVATTVATQIEGDSGAVALHCRRGDYVTHPDFGGIANIAYYERAIAKMKELVPHAHFYIFSDDIAWCRHNIPLPEASVFVSKPELKDYEELWLMSRCRHQIIANSTFSWWGAWLNPSTEKIITCPARWANSDKKNTSHREKICNGWIAV